ncbi:eukaryotic translation initiation factor 4E [Spiromyces aspiralis]|uniref:Eukaryotic translation initiation factor 4E n=1 Tax=Spiromyces aspiralis TaxID=68401 RepID=A0ACC1I0N0_9FUNG|nr:eukaryotic translation initiation factor 4E [Spiromyces aspiralis]
MADVSSTNNYRTKDERGEEVEEQTIITALDDPSKFNVKHPLQNAWTLWFDLPERKQTEKTWTQNVKPVITFRTVEDFWGVFNNITPFEDLSLGANYHFFKEGIKPMWEDPANENGGRWVAEYQRRQAKDVHNKWINIMLSLIGENYAYGDNICGVIFSNRKVCYRFSLWTRNTDDSVAIKEIGETFIKYLNYDQATEVSSINFNRHTDSRDVKPLYEVSRK